MRVCGSTVGRRARGIERAFLSSAMKHTNTAVDEREQWRVRIMRALAELRGEDSVIRSRMRGDDEREDSAADSATL